MTCSTKRKNRRNARTCAYSDQDDGSIPGRQKRAEKNIFYQREQDIRIFQNDYHRIQYTMKTFI